MKKKEYTPPIINVVNMNCVSICAGSVKENEIAVTAGDTEEPFGVSFTSDVTSETATSARSASRNYFEDWD